MSRELFANMVGELDEPIIVTINGEEYATQLYGKVQRFVPNGAVEFLVEKTLKYMLLNDLAIAVLEKKVSLPDYIKFSVMHGFSVSGLCDSIESIVQLNPHIFPGGDKDVKKYFKISNPLWDEG